MPTPSHCVRRLFAIACLSLASLTSCVSTGSVEETQAMTVDAKSLAMPAIVVQAADPDWQKDATEFKTVLAERLRSSTWQAGGSAVTCEVTFKTFDKGSKAMRMFVGSGEAEVVADVVIKDASGKALAKLSATGNSKRQSSTSFGGYDTSWGDSLPGRAVRALADQIVEYFETKKKPS